jgi:hypothetical protein
VNVRVNVRVTVNVRVNANVRVSVSVSVTVDPRPLRRPDETFDAQSVASAARAPRWHPYRV